MAQNMLNIQPDEATEKLQEDCVKESVNMICGGFLRNIDASSVFDLSLPVIDPIRGDIQVEEMENEDKVSLTFESDAGMIGVSLLFN
jgi:CheY-specific phosphatase CheX